MGENGFVGRTIGGVRQTKAVVRRTNVDVGLTKAVDVGQTALYLGQTSM